jgi:hypothetical protein
MNIKSSTIITAPGSLFSTAVVPLLNIFLPTKSPALKFLSQWSRQSIYGFFPIDSGLDLEVN